MAYNDGEDELYEEDLFPTSDEQKVTRTPTPTTLDEGRGPRPAFLFALIGVLAVVVLAIAGFYVKARFFTPSIHAADKGTQQSALAGGTVPFVIPSAAITPTPFPTQLACSPGAVLVQTPNGVGCRAPNGMMFMPGAGSNNGQQQSRNPNAGSTPLPCGVGTVDTIVQTTNGPQHECVISNNGAQANANQQQQNQQQQGGGYAPPATHAAPATPTPLPPSRIAFGTPSPDEVQAQQDITNRGGTMVQTTNGNPATNTTTRVASNTTTQNQTTSGEFASSPHYLAPQSTTQVDATSIITIKLVTKIVSDLGGAWIGQTVGDVFDSASHSIIVIPNGTKVLGIANPQVKVGVGRLATDLQSFTLPDGREFTVVGAGLQGSDSMGASGVPGDVNNHRGALFGAAAFLTFATAAESALTANAQSNPYGTPSIGSQVASAAGGQLANITNSVVGQRLNQPPTVTLEPGTTVQLIVTRALPLVPYYEAPSQ